MKRSTTAFLTLALVALVGCDSVVTPGGQGAPASGVDTEQALGAGKNAHGGKFGISIVLNTAITDAILQQLSDYGPVLDVFEQINGIRVLGSEAALSEIRGLSFVEAAGPDVERNAPPIDTVPLESFEGGLSTWNQDAVNVTTAPGFGQRGVGQTGEGVFVGVLDTGLLKSWRQYFPQERIAEEYAMSFGGGGAVGIHVSSQPNKWEHDTNSHGTHVTSTIIGYSLSGTPIDGTAPGATVIPVKVLNQNGSGWGSVVAKGILYIANLKAGPLSAHPVVINMSLGGSELEPIEKAAIDYAIEQGVIICASAGNAGENGMGYPGAYEPVISVAAAGWIGEWVGGQSWWYAGDVPEAGDLAGQFYITEFSSREKAGQDLDVAAPGSWVLGPYQLDQGHTSYYFLGGTSMAAPHVAGTVALMLQQDPSLTASEVESILESTALALPPGSRSVIWPFDGSVRTVNWDGDAAGAGLIDAAAALSPGV